MPYIPIKERKKYDKLIESLADILNGLPNNDVLSGELNYVLFRLANLLGHQDVLGTETSGRYNYARMAVIASALSEAQSEFRRRVMAPYEDKKINRVGDVKIYRYTKQRDGREWC